jgi:hypothetical protein
MPAHKARYDLTHKNVMPVPESGCWIWTGNCDSRSGYGVAGRKLRGKYTGTRVAHRSFWEFARGQVPEGMVLDHTCRVRCCVNPDHLRVVTRGENVLNNSESSAAFYASRTHCHRCGGDLVVRRGNASRKSGKHTVRRCLSCDAARSLRRYNARKVSNG